MSNPQIIFIDYSDHEPIQHNNPVCKKSCQGGHYDEKRCIHKSISTLRYALYQNYGEFQASDYPPEWLDEKVVICSLGHVCLYLPRDEQERTGKDLNRRQVVARLKEMREQIEADIPLSELESPFALTLMDICQALGLASVECQQVLGKQALAYFEEVSNRRYQPNEQMGKYLPNLPTN